MHSLLRDTIDAAVDRAMRRGRYVGLVVGASADGGIWIRGAARVGFPTPDQDTLFEIGSITKVFTGLALAIAAGRGEVELDQPVAELLPPHVALPSRRGPITLRQLATHTSGLPANPRSVLKRALLRHPDPFADLDTTALYDELPRARLRRAGFRYSNYGVGLLGHALARRSGTSYEVLIRDRICVPIGLPDTVVTPDEQHRARVAHGHRRNGTPRPPWHLDALAGAGALRSTARDLLTFLQVQLAPPPGELGAAIALTQHQHVRVNRRVSMGLCWLHLPLDRNTRMLFHNGGTGGFRSFAAVVPEHRIATVVLTNCFRSVDRIGLSVTRQLTGRYAGVPRDGRRPG